MSQRRSSILLRVMSPTGTSRKFSILPVSRTDSNISNLSFKHWHKRMQHDHEVQTGGFSFGLWHWCYKGCKPCRWFDSIDYEKKICKCCFKFKTFKAFGTLLLIVVFVYTLMFSIMKKELLPGGTVFFIFIVVSIVVAQSPWLSSQRLTLSDPVYLAQVVTAYVAGQLLIFVGLPPMLGHLLVGIIFGNVPGYMLPSYDVKVLHAVAKVFEKCLLIIAIIRAGLLLDLSKIKNHIMFICRISFFPIVTEFLIIWLVGHYLQEMPWSWSALQGSILCCLSLASVTSIMEKNRHAGYGEDKHLSTVLIAASALSVVLGVFIFTFCISYVFPGEKIDNWEWKLLAEFALELLLGLSIGAVTGLLIAFFPDKRNSEAAALRILILGIACFSAASILNQFYMPGGGVLACVTMSAIASNMWEELGWHQDSNPVQYFYTMVYYFGQPATLSLVGFTMNFQKSDSKQLGLSIALICIGLVVSCGVFMGRESMCLITTLGPLYPTSIKEKIYICIAWFSKGTFQALLAFVIEYMTEEHEKRLDPLTFQTYLGYSRRIKETTILGILITTPLAYYGLTLLTPTLLTKKEISEVSTVPHYLYTDVETQKRPGTPQTVIPTQSKKKNTTEKPG